MNFLSVVFLNDIGGVPLVVLIIEENVLQELILCSSKKKKLPRLRETNSRVYFDLDRFGDQSLPPFSSLWVQEQDFFIWSICISCISILHDLKQVCYPKLFSVLFLFNLLIHMFTWRSFESS